MDVGELGAGLLDAGVKEGHPGQLIDDSAAVPGTHRDDPGHVALHDDVAALGVHPQAPELGLELLEIAGDAVGAVGAGVGAARGDAQPTGHRPLGLPGFDPGTLFGRLKALFGLIGLPVAEVKANRDHRFGGLALLQLGAVDEVRESLSPHPAAAGEAQAEEDAVEDVAFARAVGAGDHREPLVQWDRHRSAKGLEVGQLYLIDVNQQARASSTRKVADPLSISRHGHYGVVAVPRPHGLRHDQQRCPPGAHAGAALAGQDRAGTRRAA